MEVERVDVQWVKIERVEDEWVEVQRFKVEWVEVKSDGSSVGGSWESGC